MGGLYYERKQTVLELHRSDAEGIGTQVTRVVFPELDTYGGTAYLDFRFDVAERPEGVYVALYACYDGVEVGGCEAGESVYEIPHTARLYPAGTRFPELKEEYERWLSAAYGGVAFIDGREVRLIPEMVVLE